MSEFYIVIALLHIKEQESISEGNLSQCHYDEDKTQIRVVKEEQCLFI